MNKLEVRSYQRVLANLQLLCGLGLEGRTIMPTLLSELRGLISFAATHCCWRDEQHRQHQACYPPPNTSLTCVNGFPINPTSVYTIPHLPDSLVFPTDGDPAILHAVLSVREWTLGVLTLVRKEHDPAFTEPEKKRLAALTPHIARALTNPIDTQPALVDTDEEGLIVADDSGRIHGLTPLAQRLLHEVGAFDSLAAAEEGKCLPAPLARLCHQLMRPSDDGHDAAVLLWSHQNPLGRFVFRAHYVQPLPTSSGKPLIGITVHRQEPLPLKLLRKIDTLSLSYREKLFCLLMASGHTQAVIAERMVIRKYTAIAYRRHVYTKLSVNNRAELMSKLLAL